MSEACDKKLTRRKHVIKEMYDTETTYMEYLKVVILNFVEPLEKLAEEKPFLSEFSSILFQNIIKLQELHWQMYRDMSKSYYKYCDTTNWCDNLTQMFKKNEFLKYYQVYINGYDRASILVGSAQKHQSNKSNIGCLGEFLEKQLKTTKFGFSSVTSFLIAPVQRLPRYMLFLKDLLTCTPTDHPDHPHVVEALSTLDSVIKEINTRKGVYDRIYRVEELYRMFSEEDRKDVSEITDPVRELIAEGPIIEGKKNTKLRYMLLFTDLFICSTKMGDSLTFEWKVDLCNSEIEIRKENDVEYIHTVSQNKISNYPFTLKETHELFATEDNNYSIEFWKKKIEISQNSKKNLLFLLQNSNSVSMDMQNHLLSEVGDVDLFYDWNIVEYNKSDVIRKQGRRTRHLMIIKEGTCSIQLKVGNEVSTVGKIGPGQFIGEMSYLSNEELGEIATANVIAESTVIILEKSYRKLNQSLKNNAPIAAKFFQLLCVILSNRFIRENSSKYGWIRQYEAQPQLQLINFHHVDTQKVKKKRMPTLRSKTLSLNRKLEIFTENHDSKDQKASSTVNLISSLALPKKSNEEKANKPVLPSSDSIFKSIVSPRNSRDGQTLKPYDFLIHQFHCTAKENGTYGDLLISKSCLVFSAKILGFHKKKTYSYFEIQKVEEEEENSNVLKIYYHREQSVGLKSIELIMKNSNELQRSIKTISSLIKRSSSNRSLENNNQTPNDDSSGFFILTTKDWSHLLDTAQRLKIRKGTKIIEQGSMPSALYQLVEGKCNAELLTSDVTIENVGTITKGEIFGELSFILGLVSSASVVAATDCVVMALNKSKLELMLFGNPRMAASLYRYIAKILRDRLVFNQTERSYSPRESPREQ